MSHNLYSRNTRPTWAPRTTSKKAKGEYKKHGPRLSSQEARQLDRRLELEQRARKIKDAEQRRKTNARKRAEKEDKQRQAQRNGGGPQLPRVTSSQGLLEHFMKRSKEKEATNTVEECIVEEAELEDIPEAADSSDEIYGTPIDECNDGLIGENQAPAPIPRPSQGKRKKSVEHERASQKRPKVEIITNIPLEFDDFCVSNTQIAREISEEPIAFSLPKTAPKLTTHKQRVSTTSLEQPQDPFLDMLSTQDVAFSADDIEELASTRKNTQTECQQNAPVQTTITLEKKAEERMLMPPPRIPFKPVRPTQSLHTLPRKTSPRLHSRPVLSPLSPNIAKQSRTSDASCKAVNAKPAAVELDSLLQADFVLSSQDQRDIFG